MTDKEQDPNQKNTDVLVLSLTNKEALYAAYMPFVQNGGIFIPTDQAYTLGDEIFVLLTLMDEVEKYSIAGKVVWITPRRGQARRRAGVGIQFLHEGAENLRTKIETYLAGMLQSDKPSETL